MTQTILTYLLGVNLLTLSLYGWDKFCAKSRFWRVPERTLHFLAFAGGSIGALFGQKFFRHKTRKGRFQLWFRLTLALHVLLLMVLLAISFL